MFLAGLVLRYQFLHLSYIVVDGGTCTQHEWPFVSISICSYLFIFVFNVFSTSLYQSHSARLNIDSPVPEEQAGMGEEP